MARIHLNNFLGIAPKIGRTLLGPTQAQIAKNVRLWGGTLESIQGLAFPTNLSKVAGEIKTIWSYNDNTDWLCWTQDVDVVRTPIAGDTLEKIYFSGTDTPRVTTKELYDDGSPGTSVPPASYILGIPAPVGPPVASLGGAGNITATNATWVYTFVRKWSDGTEDEGPPSVPSNALSPAAQQVSVTVPNGAITTGDYGLTHKRLYRSSGGLYFFVTEVAIGTTPATDNVATANLGTELLTTDYLPPPDELIGLVELSNGVIAGFKGNIVYMSEPYRPWAFPVRNQYATAWPIVAIGGYATTVIVATEGYPYIGRGIDPAAYVFVPAQNSYYPCVSKRSLASGEVGVFWATNDGVAIANESGVTLATREFLTHKEWDAFLPATMHGIVHEGRYYAWFSTGLDEDLNKIGGGIILDRSERAFLTTLGAYKEAAYVRSDTGEMWVATKGTNLQNQVFAFDSDPATREQYEWKSKLFISEGRDNLAFGQIIADYGSGLTQEEEDELLAQIAAIQAQNLAATSDGALNDLALNEGVLNGDTILVTPPSVDFISAGITFQYWASGILKLTRTVEVAEPFPLPSGFTAEKHEFAVTGAVEVFQVTLATSVEELASV